MPRELFEVVCVPLMGVDHTVTLGISTPDDENNYYSELFNIRTDDGKQLFKVIPVGLACETCTNAGKADRCPHRVNILPSWKSQEGQDLQRQLLSVRTYTRESMGMTENNTRRAFLKEDLERLFTQARAKVNRDSRGTLFVAIDPSGGSIWKSELAIIAGFYSSKQEIVVSENTMQQRDKRREIDEWRAIRCNSPYTQRERNAAREMRAEGCWRCRRPRGDIPAAVVRI